MRSAGGTKSGEPGVVTFSTNASIDCLALPSFQDDSGSAACAAAATRNTIAKQMVEKLEKVRFMSFSFFLDILMKLRFAYFKSSKLWSDLCDHSQKQTKTDGQNC
jgi:hypothetical protein